MSASQWFGQWEWAGQRVLEALGNGVWQGILVAGLIWAGFRLLPRLNAATRYAAAFVALLLAAALPLAQLGLKLLPSDFFQKLSPLRASEFVSEPIAHEPSASVPIVERRTPRVPFPSEPIVTDPFPVDPAGFESFPPDSYSTPTPFSWNFAALRKEWTLAVPALVTLAFLAIWLGVSTCRLAVLALQCLALRRIKRHARAGREALLQEFDRLRADMKLSRSVQLGISEQAANPMAAGFLRPMILLPPTLEPLLDSPCGRLRLEGVLRHELAHIARRDDWTNLLQHILHAVYFFHPGVCWLVRRMSLEREIACDDHVLAAAALGRGASRREYALLLTDFARQIQGPEWAAAPGAWGSENQLKERVHMILNKNRNASPRLAGAKAGVLTVGAVLIALLAMQAGPRLALADEPKTESDISIAIAGEPPRVETKIDVAVSAEPVVTTIQTKDGKSLAVSTVRGAGSSSTFHSSASGGGLVLAHTEADDSADSGPRRKSRAGAPAPHPVPAPEPPPAALAHPALPAHPAHPALPPTQPLPRRNADQDLERRLQRLERLVDNLDRKEERNNKDVWKHDFKWEMKEPNFDFKFDEGKFKEQMAKLETELKHKFNPDAMKHLHEQAAHAAERARTEAERVAEKARHEAERIARDVERSMRDQEKNAKLALKAQKDGQEKMARAGEERRKALERRRQALEKELQAIEREIDRAEDEQERIREEKEEREEQVRENRENKNSNSNDEGGDKPEVKIKKRAPQEVQSSDNVQN